MFGAGLSRKDDMVNALKFLLIIAIVLGTEPSTAELTTVSESDAPLETNAVNGTELARRLKQVSQCRDKVWPNYKIGEYPMYLVDYSAKPRKIETLDANNGTSSDDIDPKSAEYLNRMPPLAYTPKVPTKDPRTGVAINSKPKMGSNYYSGTPLCPKEVSAYEKINPLNPGTSDPYDLVTDVLSHEAYHAVDQDPNHQCNKHVPNPSGWPAVGGGREISGDIDTKSKVSYYRANMMHFLKAAAEDRGSRQSNISEAVAWYRKLKEEFPQAVKELNGVDRREGSASYVGALSSSIGKNGCASSREALKKSALDISHHRLRDIPMDHERQSYGLGLLAGLLLDEQGYGSWKKDVMDGKTPMEVLASTVKGTPKRAPKEVPSIIANRKIFDAAQSCMKREALKPIEAAYENKKMEYVAVSVPVPPVMDKAGDSMTYHNKSWDPSVSFNGSTTLKNWPTTQDTSGTCGDFKKGMRVIVLIPKSKLEANGSYTFGEDQRSVSGSVASTTPTGTMDSFKLYCGK